MDIRSQFHPFSLPSLALAPAKTKPAKEAKSEKVPTDDGDGPGAGGGYGDSIEFAPKKANDGDGPGAGGGYDDSDDVKPGDSDGPGAGGGYDDGDGVEPSDADGPGAGGGYAGINSMLSIGGTVTASWTENFGEMQSYIIAAPVASTAYTVTGMAGIGQWTLSDSTDILPILLGAKQSQVKGKLK